MQFEARANAKINLFLKIGDKRRDGFHDIVTVFQEISLCDEMAFESTPDGIDVTMEPEIPCPVKENLVNRAAALFFQKTGIKPGVRIHVKKHIPSGAGLGGGSSDAACTLKSLAKLSNVSLKTEDLVAMATMLGCDVPFFLTGGMAAGRGRGEILTPMPASAQLPLHLVVVCPGFSISTKWAYATWDLEARRSNRPEIEQFLEGLNKDNLGGRLFNDFEPMAIREYPAIGEIKSALISEGATGALLSGSGSAVFGIFPSEEAAKGATARLSSFGKTFRARPVLT